MEQMNISNIIKQLDSNQHTFKTLLTNKTKEEYLWKPEQGKWNLLEIVCHLFDEEREDFRSRIKHIFNDPSKEMPPISPEGWVLERKYASQNYEQKLIQFLSERQVSISWLNSKVDSNWNDFYIHPKLGNMSARLFLTNWLAHDYLHMRQIIKYHYEYLKVKTIINLQYAGNW